MSYQIPHGIVAKKSSYAFNKFDHVWNLCQKIFQFRCQRQHPAWSIMNQIFNTNFRSIDELEDGLYQILQLRHVYPELTYRVNWMDVFSLCVSMLRIIDEYT